MGLFGKTPQRDPKEQVNDWCRKLRKESNQIDRQIRAIQREEDKVKKTLKDAAKKGDKDVCKILAKEVIRSRRTVNKMYTSKAQINSVQLRMKEQLATLRMSGSLQQSTEVMRAMQSLIRIPEVAATMRELTKEMTKAGIIEEMLDDTFETLEDQEELEEEAQEEVDKVLWELTAGQLGKAPAAVSDSLPVHEPAGAASVAAPSEVEEGEEEELAEMQSRLQALRS